MKSLYVFVRLVVPCTLVLVCAIMSGMMAQQQEMSFRHVNYRQGLPRFIKHPDLIQDHMGRLWIAGDQGLFVYDGSRVHSFTADISDPTALTESNIIALMMDSHRQIWIGTQDMGACVYHYQTNSFTRFLPSEMGGTFPISRIWGIYECSDGIIWISGRPGLVKFDPRDSTLEHLVIEIPEITSALDQEFVNTLRDVVEDPRDPDILWICTRAGLVSLHKSTNRFKFHHMPFSSREFDLDALNYLLTDVALLDSNNLWFTSWGGGVIHYELSSGHWERFQTPGREPKYDVGYHISKKSENELWVGLNAGLAVFNTKTRSFEFLPTTNEITDGIWYSPFYGRALVTQDSAFVVLGSNGMSMADMRASSDQDPPHIRPLIGAITVNNKVLQLDTAVSFVKTLSLDEGQNDVSFTLTWPQYSVANDQCQFRYALLGFHDEWLNNGASRTVQYTNLRHGTYQFAFEASHNGTDWVSGQTSPVIKIRRPVWKHPIVLIGLSITFLGVLGVLYRMKIQHIRKEEKLKNVFSQKLAENEMKALRAQMNPHFMFNSLNSIKNFILKQDTDSASRYLTKFSKLMRLILRNSERQLITLEDELDALKLYIEIESRRFSDAFQYDIDVENDINVSEVFIPPLLIQPYIENAIWHGLMLKEGERILQLNVRREVANGESKLGIVVRDNGIGRESARSRKPQTIGKESMGMKITSDRVALINKMLGIETQVEVVDLYDANSVAKGTQVSIQIPLMTSESFVPNVAGN